jgi:hypothetical protein
MTDMWTQIFIITQISDLSDYWKAENVTLLFASGHIFALPLAASKARQ